MAQIWNYKCMFGDPERKSPLTVLKFATRYRTSVLLEFLLSWLKSSTRNGCTLMPRHEKTDWNWESVASHPRPDMGRQWTPKIIRNVSYWIGKAMIQGILILRDRFQFQDSSSWRPASIIWRWHMGPGSFHPGQHRPLEARHSTDNMVVVWLAWKRLRGIHPLCASLSLFQSFRVLVFYTSTYTYIYIHIHIYTYIHIYIYTYIHIYIYTSHISTIYIIWMIMSNFVLFMEWRSLEDATSHHVLPGSKKWEGNNRHRFRHCIPLDHLCDGLNHQIVTIVWSNPLYLCLVVSKKRIP
jgi:hypothetical protein